MNRQIQLAQQNYDLNKAAELQYGELPKLQKQLEIEEERVKNQDLSLVHESVTDEEIAALFLAGQGFRWQNLPREKKRRFLVWRMCSIEE